MLEWVLNTPLIFNLLREKLSKFVSSKNRLYLNHFSTGIYLLCNICMSLLKVTFLHPSPVSFSWIPNPERVIVSYVLQYQILSLRLSPTCIINKITWRQTSVPMCYGIFQRFLFLITCLCFAATLTNSKYFENAFTYLKVR